MKTKNKNQSHTQCLNLHRSWEHQPNPSIDGLDLDRLKQLILLVGGGASLNQRSSGSRVRNEHGRTKNTNHSRDRHGSESRVPEITTHSRTRLKRESKRRYSWRNPLKQSNERSAKQNWICTISFSNMR